MKYKNPRYRKRKNTFALEVSCGKCKRPIAIYQKGGNGNLIKMQIHRIIESQLDLETHKGHLMCDSCNMELARKDTYNDRRTYWIVRGRVNTKRLDNYR